jgi:DNA-binding transcriptional LysR family regulator
MPDRSIFACGRAEMREVAMLDWDDLRFFLAIARHHTLSAAAKHLQVTQSTVSRRLASLQEKMGVRLLQRAADGYVLTLAGESIRAHVERVETETLSVERAVAGHDTRLEGLVRVTSSQLLTSHLLAPSFAALHARHRGILIESLPDMPDEPLATQDAEIAVRLRRFEHHDHNWLYGGRFVCCRSSSNARLFLRVRMLVGNMT